MIALLLWSMFSCSKEADVSDVDLSTYSTDNFVKGPIDDWIFENLTKPYNVELKYRFDRSMGDIARNISPPETGKVIPAGEMVLEGFLKTYEKIAGKEFIRKYTPKQFALWGSLTYNTNNTVTLGTASQGRRIVLYDINNLDLKNRANVKRRLRTIHHEFTHILNQLVAIPPTFEKITPGDYTSDWTNSANTEAEAKRLGYVSRYARDQYTEDFAEMAAHLLVEGQLWFDLWVSEAGSDGAQKLRQKEAIVVDYFKQYFNIELKDLQDEVANTIDRLSPPQPFANVIQQGAISDLIDINPLNQAVSSDDFMSIWKTAVTGVAAVGGANRVLNNISIIFDSPDEITLNFAYTNSAGSGFLAYVAFEIQRDSNGNIQFVEVAPRGTGGAWGNAEGIRSGLEPVLDYFKSGPFKADWVTSVIPGSAGILGGFFKVGNSNSYLYGKTQS